MFPITDSQFDQAVKSLEIADVANATIRQIVSLANKLEGIADENFVHLEIGNPGLPAMQVGIEAECAALRSGVANKYPDIAGIPAIKENGKRFIKAFLDVDIDKQWIVPTVGSMQGIFTIMMLLKQRDPKKDTILFLKPGFPANFNQAHVVGLKSEGFDIYNYRGAKLEAKLEEMFSKGNVTAMIYSNPNNPAWTNLTDEELEIIGRMATKHDVIVLEDLAYMGMDFRTDFSHPGVAPFIPSVAKYTDNYIMLLSASKIFSYAGERIAIVAMSNAVAERHYPALQDFFKIGRFGDAYIYGILYVASSGTAHAAQYAMAEMLGQAADGKLDFVAVSREYGRRAEIVKEIFLNNGFHIIYDIDGDRPISDGFFFTAGYKDMKAGELQKELMRYGVSAITLPSSGSDQEGIRVCVSMISDDDTFEALRRRLNAFNNEH